MNIKEVVKGLQNPLIIPQDVDFRVGTANESGVSVLAYKNARVDMKRLDEVTKGQWQSFYERDPKGTLKCGISIYVEMDDDKYQWVTKYSNGSESNTESEKGQYSDAFKRAGFMWGIGRELYDMPFIWLNFEAGENKKNILRNMTWSLDNGSLTATKKGKVRFSCKLNDNHNLATPAKPKTAARTVQKSTDITVLFSRAEAFLKKNPTRDNLARVLKKYEGEFSLEQVGLLGNIVNKK